MMRRLMSLLCAMLALVATPAAPAAATPYTEAGAFVALSYHEVRDDVRDYPDPYAVDTAALVRQFAWLRGNGYTPVSLDQIVAARGGGAPLPPRAVLLSFVDAYLSFYTRVYPLLREFRYPAVLAVVGRWIDEPGSAAAVYGEKSAEMGTPAGATAGAAAGAAVVASFPNWAQLREMADSGLVELASHSYDLHRGIVANPQGNLQPAATTRLYDAASGGYENDRDWRARVSLDLANGALAIERGSGRRPRAIVWPYGSYNEELLRMAAEWGMPIALTLDDGANTAAVPLSAMRRTLVEHNPTLAEFAREVRGPELPPPLRVVQVDLDDVYSADPAQQEKNLSRLLDRMQTLKPSHVWLRATTAGNGDGSADAAYFPNRHLPLRADLFNRAAWQLASRVDVKVFAVMPLTAARLSPAQLAEVYEDLARHANFDGLVFDEGSRRDGIDDAAALAFTLELAQQVRAFRAPLLTVRSSRDGEGLAAQAAGYDYLALRAPPAGMPAAPALRGKLIPLLESSRTAGNGARLAGRMRALQRAGTLSFGYYTDDFLRDEPPLAVIAPALSLRLYPRTLEAAKP
jgi:biofilm PGA synthesis lipoprotein PgaB